MNEIFVSFASCSLPLSAVQCSLQKTPVWRDWPHHHEPARCKNCLTFWVEFYTSLIQSERVIAPLPPLALVCCRTSVTTSTRCQWSKVWWWTWKWGRRASRFPAIATTRWVPRFGHLNKNIHFFQSFFFFQMHNRLLKLLTGHHNKEIWKKKVCRELGGNLEFSHCNHDYYWLKCQSLLNLISHPCEFNWAQIVPSEPFHCCKINNVVSFIADNCTLKYYFVCSLKTTQSRCPSHLVSGLQLGGSCVEYPTSRLIWCHCGHRLFSWWRPWTSRMSTCWPWGRVSTTAPTPIWCVSRTTTATTKRRPSASTTSLAKVTTQESCHSVFLPKKNQR